jgi:hypothetical protein
MNFVFEILDCTPDPLDSIMATHIISPRTARVQAEQLLATYAPKGVIAVRVLDYRGEEMYRLTSWRQWTRTR